MTLPILYTFRRCPYAMRARLALHKTGIRYELREVELKAKPAEMLVLSRKGTVPVLSLMDGSVIDESLDVMLWALRQHDPDGWLDIDMDAGKTLIDRNDTDFKYWLDRYKYHVRYPEYSELDYREKAERFIGVLEQLLTGHNGAGLLADKWTLADAAIFPFVRQFACVDRPWFDASGHERVARWLRRWEQSDLFKSIMHKHKPWQADTAAA